jgi:hypothetical protein
VNRKAGDAVSVVVHGYISGSKSRSRERPKSSRCRVARRN